MSTTDTPISALLAWIANTPRESRLDMLFLTVYPLSHYVKGLEFSSDDAGEAGLHAWLTSVDADSPSVAVSKLKTVVAHLTDFIEDRASEASWEKARQRMDASVASIQADEGMDASRKASMLDTAERVTDGFPSRHQAGIDLAKSWEGLRAGSLSAAVISAWESELRVAELQASVRVRRM